jgi:hypothetical protein
LIQEFELNVRAYALQLRDLAQRGVPALDRISKSIEREVKRLQVSALTCLNECADGGRRITFNVYVLGPERYRLRISGLEIVVQGGHPLWRYGRGSVQYPLGVAHDRIRIFYARPDWL